MSADTGEKDLLTVGDVTSGLGRSWWVVALITLVGAGAGLGAASLHKTEYTAESRLLVGKSDVVSEAIPGYAAATAQMASTYARLLTNNTVQDQLNTKLGSAKDAVTSVAASPIPQSAIIRIETKAKDKADAVAAASAAASVLQDVVAQVQNGGGSSDELFSTYTEAARVAGQAQAQLAQAQNRLSSLTTGSARASGGAIQAASNALAQAQADYNTLNLKAQVAANAYSQQVQSERNSSSGVTVTDTAASTGDDRKSTLELGGAAGLGAGAVLGTLAASLIARRRRTRPEPAVRRHRAVTDDDGSTLPPVRNEVLTPAAAPASSDRAPFSPVGGPFVGGSGPAASEGLGFS